MPSPDQERHASSRQIALFIASGLGSAVAHYGLLIGLVEKARWAPVPATLCGYLFGGIVSYALNRRLTFESARAHHAAIWRFVVVAGVGFALTAAFMEVLTARFALPYLAAQVVTTGLVLVWSFVAHKFWTFRPMPPL